MEHGLQRSCQDLAGELDPACHSDTSEKDEDFIILSSLSS